MSCLAQLPSRYESAMAISLKKIFTLFASILLLFGGFTMLASYQAKRHAHAATEANQRRYVSYQLADELRQSSDDLTRLARTYVVSGDPKWEQQYFEVLDIRNGKRPRPRHYERIYWDFRAADQNPTSETDPAVPLVELMKRAGFTEQEFAKLNEAAANSNDLVRTETVAMNMVKGLFDDGAGNFTRKGEPDLAKAREMMHNAKYHSDKAKIMKPLNDFLALLDERTAGETAEAIALSERWGALAQTAVILLILTLAALLWWTRANTLDLISRVGRVAGQIAGGDLSHEVEIQGSSEGREILSSLGDMRTKLFDIIAQVREQSDGIATASSEIATGNIDLSQRTEEQASNLQQTAASMEQITGTVRNSAAVARQADALANQAAQAAGSGGELVGYLVATMSGISESSNRITDIIGVIDSIAFQTNILALNAAVEAARAGEQGRGFAVVASEVRALAQRSAAAAKEIKQLISDSTGKVAVGSQQADAAGSSMREIVVQVQNVSKLIGEISHAAEEQTQGIGQVGQAVAQLDQVTQQNAALVEQSAAAADSLKHQAAKLADLVAQFKLA